MPACSGPRPCDGTLMEPRMGFEPTTPALRKRCSTVELSRQALNGNNLHSPLLRGNFFRNRCAIRGGFLRDGRLGGDEHLDEPRRVSFGARCTWRRVIASEEFLAPP